MRIVIFFIEEVQAAVDQSSSNSAPSPEEQVF